MDLGVPCEAIVHGDAQSAMHRRGVDSGQDGARSTVCANGMPFSRNSGLARHKGYSTDEHIEALRKYGPTMLHRFSFEPVRLACSFPVWSGYDEKGDDLVQHATA